MEREVFHNVLSRCVLRRRYGGPPSHGIYTYGDICRYLVETSRHYDSIVAERFLVTGHPEFVVKAGNLVFSVIVFCTAAVICLATLEARRYIKCVRFLLDWFTVQS